MTSVKSKPTKGKLQGISAIARISIVKDGNSTKSQIQEIISKVVSKVPDAQVMI